MLLQPIGIFKPGLLLGALGLLLPTMAAAQAEPGEQSAPAGLRHTTAVAFYYSRGSYGESRDTRIRYMPVSHEVAGGSWRFKTTVPVLEISGPANVLVNVGSIGGGFSDSRVSPRGIGDVSFNLTYEVPAWSANAPFIDISAELKTPTADPERGLGTGRADAALQVDLYQMISRFTVFVSAGYRYRRESPWYPDLQNSLAGSLGFSTSLGETIQYGLIYDYRQAAAAFTDETHELLPYASWAMSPQWTLMAYAVKGFNEDSADLGAGLQLSHRW